MTNSIRKVFNAAPNNPVRLVVASGYQEERGRTFSYESVGHGRFLVYAMVGFGGTAISAGRSERAWRDRYQLVGVANERTGHVSLVSRDIRWEAHVACLANAFRARGWDVDCCATYDGENYILRAQDPTGVELKRDRNRNKSREKVAGIDLAVAMRQRRGG